MQNEIKNKEDLIRKKQRLEKEVELEVNLLPSLPKILGIAVVLPRKATPSAMSEDPEIEAIGMKITMDYEKGQQRNPEDVSMQNLGFDIRSTSSDGKIRYIEVKARAKTGEIAITPNEWLMAARLKDEYWLYVVENAATSPKLYCIQNPKDNLRAVEEVEIVRFVVKNWKDKAEAVR